MIAPRDAGPTPDRHSPLAPPRVGRSWVLPLLALVLGFVIVHPFDARLHAAALRLAGALPGDLSRELQAWQQYGQGFALVVVAITIWLLDPARRRRLLDLGLALLVAQAISTGGKMLIGRPRPRPDFNDPATFFTPWGEYPIRIDGRPKLVHAWDTAAGASTDLWSMPSSHTLFAAMLSVFLATLYPRLRWLMLALTLLVGMGRVLFDAHWPSDVVVGAGAGWLVGRLVVPGFAGIRLLDWIWVRFVNRRATPALPAVLANERARTASR
jgi:membrane-associated phospholipid phosphatase